MPAARIGSPVAGVRPGPTRSVGATWALCLVTLGLYGYYISARIYRDTQQALAGVPTAHRPANALPLFMIGSLIFGPLPATARLQMFENLLGYRPTTSYLKTIGAQLLLGGWAYQQSRLNALWADPMFDTSPGTERPTLVHQ